MDRRKSIKSLVLGGVAGGLALHGCKTEVEAEKEQEAIAKLYSYGRTPEETELIAELEAEEFFNEHEMETISVLCALILPANEQYGSAADAGAPEFIEFMVKDYPPFQVTLRGGLMWLDHKSNTEFGTEFKVTPEAQQKEILDTIAFYDPEISMDKQALEIQFFSVMRNLALTGYYTSKMGIEDLGYKGNMPNVWDGVPQEVLDQHGVTYDEEWLTKCVDQSKRGVIAEWDEKGNLLT
ncbi:MAG: gluconate 2-dehydrogenase subunit 3 family protein [Eudoraea sp.]|nr:gluconate 2-dehydrogenase subunit 3 family protein [Eudoraea sp.]